LVGLYALGVTAFVSSSRNSHRHKSWLIAGWLIAVAVGLDGYGFLNHQLSGRGSDQLECRALAVGHGNACVVKCPNGKTILIDAGSMENGQFAASIVQANLADMGADRLDAILLSHTDLDHINAIPFLIEQIPIREILLNPVGLNPQHPAMLAIASQAFERNIKLRTIRKDDLIKLDPEVAIRIKQCPNSPLEKTGNDNADSIVVEIEYHDKRLLFPGDLEDEGQTGLMQQASPGYDMLLAPHHGGKHENRPEFANWVNAKNVIVSTNDSKSRTRIETVYGPSRNIYFTSEGAIRILVSQEGHLKLSQWQPKQFWKSNK
jgi:competence protein ComEC